MEKPISPIETTARQTTLPTGEAFDRLSRLAAMTLGVPICLITRVEPEQVLIASQYGLPEPWASLTALPHSHALCQHILARNEPLVIDDTRASPLARDNPAINELGVLSYLGVPLVGGTGTLFGALCVIDYAPRHWTADQVTAMVDFASIVSDELRLRLQLDLQERLRHDLDRNNQRFALTIANIAHGLCFYGPDERLEVANQQYADMYRLDPEDIRPGTSLRSILARRIERGSDPVMSPDAYIAWRRASDRHVGEARIIQLRDGRSIRIFINPTADGGWVAINEDITPQLATEALIREQERQYKLLATHSGDVIILRERNGRRLYCSPAIEALTGYPIDEAMRTPLTEWVHPQDVKPLQDAFDSLSPGQPRATIVHRFRRKSGEYIWVEATLALVDEDDRNSRIVCNIRDVTGRKKAEREYRDLFEHSIVGIYRKSLDHRLLRANPALVAMAGFESEAELLQSGLAQCFTDARRRNEKLQILHNQGLVRDFQNVIVSPVTGHTMWVSETAWIVRSEEGEPLYIEGMLADISESVAAQSRLRHLAEKDQLTGLANRFTLRAKLDEAIHHAMTSGIYPALIYIDLDRFKSVNDSFGHPAGDELLVQIAERIAGTVGNLGVISRMGGDEFAVLLTEPDSIAQADKLAIRLISTINQVVHLSGGQRASVGASIGIAGAAPSDADIDQVKRRADLAMYQAKRDGRNAFRRYSQALECQFNERQQIETGLREAITQDQFDVHFQPILDLSRLVPCGFEALVRWRHPDGTMVSPAAFIPIAEESGLIVPIGEIVMRRAMKVAATWPGHLRLALNASVMQLRHPDFLGSLMTAMTRTGLSPERLEIEVTESALLDDSPTTLAVLQKLQMLGIRVALDDFGTGWSSLSYLNRHRFDRIKIDRSFVKGISDRRNEAIIQTITDLGNRIGMEITAEGVETGEQQSLLTKIGCHEAQGFLFGKPMPGPETHTFLKGYVNAKGQSQPDHYPRFAGL